MPEDDLFLTDDPVPVRGPGQHGRPQQGGPQHRPTHTRALPISGKATASMWLGITTILMVLFSICPILWIITGPVLAVTIVVGLILGVWGLMDISRSNGELAGQGQSVVGLVANTVGAGSVALVTFGLIALGNVDTDKEGGVAGGTAGQISAPATETEKLRAKLETWKQNRQKFEETIASFTDQREKVRSELKEMGVKSASDLEPGDSAGRRLATELLEIERDTRLVRQKLEAHDEAIARLETSLRTLERKESLKDAGISDEDLAELNATVLELEDKLDVADKPSPLQDLQIEDVLQRELQ